MFHNCPCIQIKDVSMSVTLGQTKLTQAEIIYNNCKNICLHYNIKYESLARCKLDRRSEKHWHQSESNGSGDGQHSSGSGTKLDFNQNQ